jgi:hypothetical protein
LCGLHRLSIICPPFYFGRLCQEKQNISNSVLAGFILFAVGIVMTFIVLWGAWFSKVPFDKLTESLVARARCPHMM